MRVARRHLLRQGFSRRVVRQHLALLAKMDLERARRNHAVLKRLRMKGRIRYTGGS